MRNDYEQRADHDADPTRDDEPTRVIAPPRDGVPHPRTAADDEEQTRVFDTSDPASHSTVDTPAGDLPGGTLTGRSDVEEQAGWRPDGGSDTTAVGHASVDDALARGAAEREELARDDLSFSDTDRADTDRADTDRADIAHDDTGRADTDRADLAHDDTGRDEATARTELGDRADTSDAIAPEDRGVGDWADADRPGGDYRVADDPDRSAVDDRLTAADEGTFDSPADDKLTTGADQAEDRDADTHRPDGPAGTVVTGAPAEQVDTADAPDADATPTTADTTVTAPDEAPAAAVATDTADATETDTAAGQAPELLPGDAPAAPVGGLWAEGQRDQFRDRWRDVQLKFVDDPKAAAEEAHALVIVVVETLTSSLTRQCDELAGWRGADKHDTEELRMALRRYRDFLDQITR
jgi:hypothetical protein